MMTLFFQAINHPIGQVTEALLRWWYRDELVDGQYLPEPLKIIFTEICDVKIDKYLHGRLLLAANVITLFRVDESWTKQSLLGLFDWQRSEVEARTAWEGFLWSPKLYRPMMKEFTPAFLETAKHYLKLGQHRRQYVSLLIFVALDNGDIFTSTQLINAIHSLPLDGLNDAAQALLQAQEGAGQQREDYWKNRVRPFWEKIWPKSNEYALSSNPDTLVRLCIATGNEFPSAMAVIGIWLRPIQHPYSIIKRLHESDLSSKFPEASLALLDTILDLQQSFYSPDLQLCLKAILQVMPDLRQDRRFMKVDELERLSGR